ncbi:Bifunctional purine biosynthesis protein PurH [Mucor velutinosus]|uniref:Bifunctional purine biosynthesis protein PurH n=1 Tax=Mucor velutinosus TaxID=708070 RepID=A0AAN7DMU2_9FUNG|nr:Bifunctional purine biosynthesis protein PurH [Mucor velutinosus]
MEDPLSIRRHTLPSTMFVDPAIVRFIEKPSSSSSPSAFLNHLPQQQQQQQQAQQEKVEEEEDDDSIISSSIASSPFMQHQKPSPPQPTASTSLDHLWSKQEKYDSLELRLFALEESERRFEHRLQVLEKNKNNMLQPMKPDQHGQEIMQQQQHQQKQQHDPANHPHDGVVIDDSNYMDLYHSLLEKYNQLQIETKEKEAYYQQRIKLLTEKQQQPCQRQATRHASTPTAASEKKKEQVTEKEAYREEDGYLIFDTTSMNGEITHCRVKIPSSQTCHNSHYKQDPSSVFASPPATRVGSPQYHSPLPSSQHYYHHHITSPKKGLNPNAPEWRKTSYRH